MKYAAALLSAIALAAALPAIADARPDGRGGRMGGGGGGRGEHFFAGGGGKHGFRGDGGPRMEGRGPYGRPDPRFYGRPDRRPYDGRPVFVPRNHPPNSLGAGWRQQQDEARQGVRQGRFIPLRQVLPELRRRSPGRQLDAGIEQGFDGRPVYRVRWGAANGRRIDYIIDAQTGRIIGVDR
jgi:hypothetical protein